ncbi:MAG: CapA family protein [Oscillospiraceae bacterium]|nr:CapA family protein [Oscillospiraceae bacterium]
MSKTTFIATGDAFITRRIPENGYEGFDRLRACIRAHDVAFSNLEMTFHDREGTPNAVSGGTWAMTDPAMLDDMRRYGFNLFTTANNHSCDYSHDGLLATIRHLKERDMVFSGTGATLSDASRPCYLEAKGTRVALISVCSTFNPTDRAGDRTTDLPGRPGLNPLRYTRLYHLDEAHFAAAQELAAVSGVNIPRERSIRNGYANPFPEGRLTLGSTEFVRDTRCYIESVPNKQDMARVEREIREACRQADVVLVSLHAHECDGEKTNVPSQFVETFCRTCIDAGATAVLGHGPHELRGIELYKEGVIFYSVGNFIFETETVSLQPWDAYINKSMSPDTKVGQFMDTRSQNGTRGYAVQEWIWKAVMAGFTVEDGRITQVQLYPIELGQNKSRAQRGKPILSEDEGILTYLADLSKPYGTQIRIENGVGIIDL